MMGVSSKVMWREEDEKRQQQGGEGWATTLCCTLSARSWQPCVMVDVVVKGMCVSFCFCGGKWCVYREYRPRSLQRGCLKKKGKPKEQGGQNQASLQKRQA